MKTAAEEKKARSSMTSTFSSVMNPDADRDFKHSLDQLMKHKGHYGRDYEREVVSKSLGVRANEFCMLLGHH